MDASTLQPVLAAALLLLVALATHRFGRHFRLAVEERAIVFGSLFFLPMQWLGVAAAVGAGGRLSLGAALATVLGLFALGEFAGSRAVGPVSVAYPARAARTVGGPRSAPLRLLQLGVAAASLIAVSALLIGFPRGFEGVAYHLPISVNSFRDGGLYIWDTAQMHTLPANQSLVTGFALQALPERLVSVLPWMIGLFAFWGLHRLCLACGLMPQTAGLLTLGSVSIPMFGFNALEIGADLGGLAFLLLAAALLIGSTHHRRLTVLLIGAACGLAYGFKPLHLIPSALFAVVLCADAAGVEVEASLWRRAGRALAAAGMFTIGFAVTVGPWWLRGYWMFDNPFYPIHLPILSDLMRWPASPDFWKEHSAETQYEWVRSSLEWLVYPWVEWHFIGQNFKAHAGLRPFFAATIPPAWLAFTGALFAGVIAWCRRRSHVGTCWPARPLLLCYALGSVVLGLWFVLEDRQPRYTLAGIAFLLPLFGAFLDRMPTKTRRCVEWLVSVSALGMLGVIMTLFLSKQLPHLSKGIPSRADYYEYPYALDRLPPGSTVLNLVGRNVNYMLYGEGLSNRVWSSTLLPYLGRLREDGSLSLFPEALRNRGVTHVYVSDGERRLLSGGCLRFEPLEIMSRNRYNGRPLPASRGVYRVTIECMAETEVLRPEPAA
ncbi:MAG TPA: hypothetical protein PKC22_00965 [Rhodocyclaceae bacterium]|nr:hypothetical protein [Rhodocyclaceae bacterium]